MSGIEPIIGRGFRPPLSTTEALCREQPGTDLEGSGTNPVDDAARSRSFAKCSQLFALPNFSRLSLVPLTRRSTSPISPECAARSSVPKCR